MVTDKKSSNTITHPPIPTLPVNLGQHMVPEIIAQAVVDAVERIPPEKVIGFYGCGGVAKIMIKKHANALAARNIFFIETNPGKSNFFGHPRINPQAAITKKPNRIFILSTLHDNAMVSNLVGVPKQIIICADSLVAQLSDERMEQIYLSDRNKDIQKAIKQVRALSSNGKPVILLGLSDFVHESLKLLYFIKKSGWNAVLFTADDRVNHMSLNPYRKLGYFDHLVISSAYAFDLLYVANQTNVSIIHFDVGVGPGLPVAQVLLRTNVPVFVRYLDIKELTFWGDNHKWRQHAGVRFYPYERHAAEIIFKKSRGLIFKDSPLAMDILSTYYKHKPKQLYFPGYPAKTFAASVDLQPKYSTIDGKIHLVFCGFLFNEPNAKLRVFFQSILTAARILAEQDICLTVYNGLDSDGDGYDEYTDFAREQDDFQYKFARRPDEIGTAMARYDIGFFCFDQTKNPYSELYKQTTFMSNIFAFLEAGLPIIVSAETPFMAHFVKENELGIAVSWHEMSRVREIIETTQWSSIHRSIAMKKETWAMESQIKKLSDFYLGGND